MEPTARHSPPYRRQELGSSWGGVLVTRTGWLHGCPDAAAGIGRRRRLEVAPPETAIGGDTASRGGAISRSVFAAALAIALLVGLIVGLLAEM